MQYWTYAELKDKIQKDLDLEQETFVAPTELLGYANEAIDFVEAEIHTINEDYFLAKANLALVAGTSDYDLPSDIFANKIRAVIYNDGNRMYEVKRIRKVNKFYDIAVTNHYNTDDIYRYIILNNSATDNPQLHLVPPSKETSANHVTVWYLRNANPVADDTSVIDIPEFINVVIQHMKVRCYEKEGNPNLDGAKAELQVLIKQMQDTLTQMVVDEETELMADLSAYYDSVGFDQSTHNY